MIDEDIIKSISKIYVNNLIKFATTNVEEMNNVDVDIIQEFNNTIDKQIENQIVKDLSRTNNISNISNISNGPDELDNLVCDELDENILEEIEKTKDIEEKNDSEENIYYHHCYDSDNTSYSTSYSLEGNSNRIVISIFCTKNSIKYIKNTIDNIENQDFDCIYIVISQDLVGILPVIYRTKYEIIVCKTDNPINKIFPVLLRETDPQTIICTIEIGVLYPNTIIKEIKKSFKRFPTSSHALSLLKFKSVNYFEYIYINGNVGDIFDSFYLVAYKRYFFKNDFKSYLDLLLNYDYCKYSDDLIVSNYLYKYKISIRCINRKKFNKTCCQYLLTKECIHTTSGFNRKIILRYYNVIELLVKLCLLYLKNPNSIRQCFNYLTSQPYNLAIGMN